MANISIKIRKNRLFRERIIWYVILFDLAIRVVQSERSWESAFYVIEFHFKCRISYNMWKIKWSLYPFDRDFPDVPTSNFSIVIHTLVAFYSNIFIFQ